MDASVFLRLRPLHDQPAHIHERVVGLIVPVAHVPVPMCKVYVA